MALPDGAGSVSSNSAAETNVVTAETSARPEGEGPGTRGDVSAVTVARMMGLATLGEVKLVENKVDLMATKLSVVQVKLEKITTMLQGMPSGADLERIDVHIGTMKQMLKEVLGDRAAAVEEGAVKKPSSKIVTN